MTNIDENLIPYFVTHWEKANVYILSGVSENAKRGDIIEACTMEACAENENETRLFKITSIHWDGDGYSAEAGGLGVSKNAK